MRLTNFKALTFDCYGTLIDWESGIWDALQPVIQHNSRNDIHRQAGLEAFAKFEAEQERATPDMLYPELLTEVHKKITSHFNLESDKSIETDFGQSVPHWPAFPDTADALRILKQHFKLVILSNVNRDGFAASNRKLGIDFDAIYTAEDVGSYKPNPANFAFMIDHLQKDLNIKPSEILHTAQSMHHDHVPAQTAGLNKAWIDRQNLKNTSNWGATAMVESMPKVEYRFTTLAEMADAVLLETTPAG